MKKITRDWLDSAEDDLRVILIIIDDINLTNQIAFHAQQAIEKSLKAIVEEFEIGFIRTHSLETLIQKTNSYIPIPSDLTTIRKLDQLYIDARYPGDLGLLPNGKPGIDEALEFKKVAENIYVKVYDYLQSKK
jgi:HEPN domain-containing protein